MGPRFREDDGFKADKLKTVILAQARTHTTPIEVQTHASSDRKNNRGYFNHPRCLKYKNGAIALITIKVSDH
jgi:hypothetical protein